MQKEEKEKIISSGALKILVGGLLVYYAYALAFELHAPWGTKQIVLAVFALLFVVVGIVFALTGLISLVKLFKQEKQKPDFGRVMQEQKTEENSGKNLEN